MNYYFLMVIIKTVEKNTTLKNTLYIKRYNGYFSLPQAVIHDFPILSRQFKPFI